MKHELQKFLIASLSLALVACGGSSSAPAPIVDIEVPPKSGKIDPAKARLAPGLSCDALKTYIVDALVEEYLSPSSCAEVCTFVGVPTASPTDASTELTVSETNVQEPGVDESDIIKADSEGLLYIAADQQLLVAKGFPATELDVLSDYQFETRIESLFLDEARNRLIVRLSSNYDLYSFSSSDVASNSLIDHAYSQVKFFDTTNPAALVEIESIQLSGWNISERYVDGVLYLVSSNQLRFAVSLYDEEFGDAYSSYHQAVADGNSEQIEVIGAQIRSIIQSLVDAQSIDNFLPATLTTENDVAVRTPILGCTDIYKPDVSVALSLPTIYKISSDGEFLEGIGAIASVADIYASEKNFYLWQSSNSWWWSQDQDHETAIHQISIEGDAMNYVGVGIVPGGATNRFNLSEHNGYLRVATSERLVGDDLVPQRRNHMHVLRADGQGDLSIVGKTQNYADNEQIFSARFMGDKGFVVTFLQIDPLFSFDLSVPESPKIVGELEIPGFSEYIHPVGENQLLTVGRNGDENGLLPGVRLQLFDVSDLANPMLLHSYVPPAANGSTGYAWTEASYDPHAFTYFAQDNLLSIPLTIYGESFSGQQFSGFVVMEVTANNGFVELGRVSHEELAEQYYCSHETGSLIANCGLGNYVNWTNPRRTVVMKQGDQTILYTMSDVGLKASPANQPGESISSFSFFGF